MPIRGGVKAFLLACGAALVFGVVTAGAHGDARDTSRLPVEPRLAALGSDPLVTIRDRVVDDGRRLAAAARASSHGGTYTAASGDHVKVYVSDAYPADDSVNQHWADFLAGLVHGTELAKVTVYVAPMPELATLCHSTEADACYLMQPEEMVVPGDPTPDGAPIEELVAHEYGHHIANNRNNAPWAAVDWGTKRWASYEHVCGRVATRTAFPGDEAANYFRNPGEAFAESYRLLIDQRAGRGLTVLPWRMDGFQPDANALSLLQQDIEKPWVGTTVMHWRGRLPTGGIRRVLLPTPLDGYARFDLSAPSGSALLLYDGKTGKLLGGARREIRYGICDARSAWLRVALPRGGAFSVSIFRP